MKNNQKWNCYSKRDDDIATLKQKKEHPNRQENAWLLNIAL